MFASSRIRELLTTCVFVSGCTAFSQRTAAAPDLAESRRALMQGRIPEALAQLHAATAANPQNGEAHLLLCRTYYSEHLIDPAVQECEAALKSLSGNSEAQDYMGKAYGLKAEKAGPFGGYSLAKKVKTSFETAVSINPSNGDAVDDLGEYYLQAPGIVGGGIDKAKALAERLKNPDQTLRLKAAIAEKEKDYAAAERLLREHTQTSKERADTWLDLATFYKRRNQPDQALEALHHAEAAAHNKSSVLVGIGELLNELQREPETAIKNLQVYINGGNTDDSAPTFKAHVLLGKILAARGDKASARIEFNKALALAPDYAPAKKALSSL